MYVKLWTLYSEILQYISYISISKAYRTNIKIILLKFSWLILRYVWTLDIDVCIQLLNNVLLVIIKPLITCRVASPLQNKLEKGPSLVLNILNVFDLNVWALYVCWGNTVCMESYYHAYFACYGEGGEGETDL